MAKIYFFGTCSGTEPIEGRQHLAFAIEVNGAYYWFDAGENCSRTAYLMGVELMKIKAIFISHTHMDHIGGLGNLLWNIRKLTTLGPQRPSGKKIEVYIPNMTVWSALLEILKNTEGGFECDFDIAAGEVRDGTVYRDENITVTAFHNHHLPVGGDGKWKSYSYLIEADGKKIVFSGDVRDVYDLDRIIGGGCDVLMMETGHHKIDDIKNYTDEKNIRRLLLVHHGREILNDRQSVSAKLRHFKCDSLICDDKTVLDI